MKKKTAEKQVTTLGTRVKKLGGQLQKAREKAGAVRGDSRVRTLRKQLRRSQRRAAHLARALAPKPAAEKKDG
jgi:predicted  nucleic acid-binding Zn-ribbon protein